MAKWVLAAGDGGSRAKRQQGVNSQKLANSPMKSHRNMDQKSDSRDLFFDLFRRHWTAGTGLEPRYRDGGWTHRAFGEAVRRAGMKSPDAETVASWLRAERWPKASRKLAILAAFFPPGTTDAVLRAEMSKAWDDGDRLPVSLPRTTHAADAPPPKWVRFDEMGVEGLAEMTLAEPIPHSNEEGVFRIEGAPRVNVAAIDVDGRDLRIGLTSVFLGFQSQGYVVRPESLISERTGDPLMRTVVGGVEFIASGEGAFVDGSLLKGDYFAVVESTNNGEAPVTLSLRAGRRSFRVVEFDEKGRRKDIEPSEERDAIVNILLGKERNKDSLGRVLLARLSMKRLSP